MAQFVLLKIVVIVALCAAIGHAHPSIDGGAADVATAAAGDESPFDLSEREFRTGFVMQDITPSNYINTLKPITPEALQPIFVVFNGTGPNDSKVFQGPHNDSLCATMRDYVKVTKPKDTHKLLVFVHGFVQKWDDAPHLRIRDALFTQKKEKVMFVLVDAKLGFQISNYMPRSSYIQAALNTRTVGMQMALVTNCLTSGENPLFTLNNTHLVGFSLGGHVVGMAGHWLQNMTATGTKVGRITGLDPAGPWFSRETDLTYKLSPDDGDFVDVIHTSWGGVWGFGTDEELGHIDFYPQSSNTLGVIPSSYMCLPLPVVGAACEHMASLELFMESIYRHYSCVMKGWRCKSWYHFADGLCDVTDENSVQMGYFLTKGEYLAALKPQTLGEVVQQGVTNIANAVVASLPLPKLKKSLGLTVDGRQPRDYRLMERLPVIGQFFLDTTSDDPNAVSARDASNTTKTPTAAFKNTYYLNVRSIYPYCVSEVEQLRWTKPETCSETYGPVGWLGCMARKVADNGGQGVIYNIFSAFKSYGNLFNSDIG